MIKWNKEQQWFHQHHVRSQEILILLSGKFRTLSINLDGVFVKIVNSFQPLTIFTKSFILDIWQSSEYTCFYTNTTYKFRRFWHCQFYRNLNIYYQRLLNPFLVKVPFSYPMKIVFSEGTKEEHWPEIG